MDSEVVFLLICRSLRYECLSQVSEEADVSAATLYRWREGKVRSPSSRTLNRVANWYGYSQIWTEQ